VHRWTGFACGADGVELRPRQHHLTALQDRGHLVGTKPRQTAPGVKARKTTTMEARRAGKGERRDEPLLSGAPGDAALVEYAGEQPTCTAEQAAEQSSVSSAERIG